MAIVVLLHTDYAPFVCMMVAEVYGQAGGLGLREAAYLLACCFVLLLACFEIAIHCIAQASLELTSSR